MPLGAPQEPLSSATPTSPRPGGSRPAASSSRTSTQSRSDEGGAKTLWIRIINDKTPHNVPADSRNRALDLVLTFFEAGGKPFPAADGNRELGREPGTYRMRFRNPYRSEIGMQNTQIVSGTEAVLDAPVPPDAVRARIELLYKLTPYTTDDEAIEIFSDEIGSLR